jgi:cupin fold WbuC family metalloprotein
MDKRKHLVNFTSTSSEVLYPTAPGIVAISSNDVEALIEKSSETTRRRIRICAHAKSTDQLHEMIIVHEKGAYVRPHKHLGRSESFHIVKGRADIIIFNEDGSIRDIIQMGEYSSNHNFFYRLNDNLYHSMLIYSDHLVFHESTLGPFDPATSSFAPWSPPADDIPAAVKFISELGLQVEDRLSQIR